MILHDILYSFQSFGQLVFLGAKRDANVAFSVTAKDETWGDEYTGFIQYFFGQLFHIIVSAKAFAPISVNALLPVFASV